MFRGLGSLCSKRGVHTVPKLAQLPELNQLGIPGILSARGFDIAWNQQQKYLCEKLSLSTSGTSLESYFPFHIVLNTAKKPFQSNIFNAASAAHNNHLFIENILPVKKTVSAEQNQPSRLFQAALNRSFKGATWDQIKVEMANIAKNEVIGQGWLFLVENANKELQILTINNNGTPYYFPRNQSIDLNTAISLKEYSYMQEITKAVRQNNGKVADWTIPLICINLCDYAYLHDYGVAGRHTYVQKALNNLNWTVINSRLYSDAQI